MAIKKIKKDSTSNDCFSKSDFQKLECRLSLNFDNIARDMSDVQTRVHKLENENTKAAKEEDSYDELNKSCLSFLGFFARGLSVVGFICLTLACVRDVILSIIGA